MPSANTETTGSKANAQDIGEDISAELAQIRKDIATLANTLATYGKARAEAFPDLASESAEQTLEAVKHALDDIRREANALEHTVGRKVAEHPIQTLMIAAGLGFLFAYLSRR